MRNYRKLKEDLHDAQAQVMEGVGNLRTVAQDARRVSKIAQDVHIIIKDIDKQFAQATKLTSLDITFLFFAVALQCLRQYLLTNFKPRLDDQAAAKPTKDLETALFGEKTEQFGRTQSWYNPTFEEVVFNPVPFDTTFGSPDFDLNLGGGFNHRASTLGHDPLLGWIFGTMNIATSTLTTWQFESFHVKSGLIATGTLRDKITNHADTYKVFTTTVNKLLDSDTDGKLIVGASLIKEAIHLKSDVNSKVSLPLPLISTISPDFAKQLAEFGLDMANIGAVFKQAVIAGLINTFIAMIHGLFYDEKECGSRSLYEVRTRKILSYSNVIASSSNIVVVAITQDIKKLDIGGLLVTLYRVVSDYNFIQRIKREFLEKEFYNTVMGEEFNF